MGEDRTDKTPRTKNTKIRLRKVHIILLLIVLFGFSIRFGGFLRGDPISYHPDGYLLPEKIQAMMNFEDRVDTKHYGWPGETIYGFYSIFFILLKFLGNEVALDTIKRTLQFNSVIFGTLTIIAVYVLTEKLFTKRAALFASALFSVLMYHILISSWETADATLIFFMTCTYIALVPLIRQQYISGEKTEGFLFSNGKLRINKTLVVIAGFFILSTFTKWSGLTLLYPIVAAIILHYGFLDDMFINKHINVKKVKKAAIMFGVIILFAFIISLIVWPTWPANRAEIGKWIEFGQRTHSQGHFGVFPTKGMNILDYQMSVFPIIRHSAGLAFSLAALAGLLFLLFRHRKEDLFIASSVLVYLLFIGKYPVRLARYYIVIFPLLAVMAGVLFDAISSNKKQVVKYIGFGLFTTVFAFTLALGLAYAAITINEDVRVTAGNWINENIPLGSDIMFAPHLLTHTSPKFFYNGYMVSSRPEYIIVTEPTTFVFLRYARHPELFRPEDWQNKLPSKKVLEFYSSVPTGESRFALIKSFNVTPQFGPYTYTENKEWTYDLWSVTHPGIQIYKREPS